MRDSANISKGLVRVLATWYVLQILHSMSVLDILFDRLRPQYCSEYRLIAQHEEIEKPPAKFLR